MKAPLGRLVWLRKQACRHKHFSCAFTFHFKISLKMPYAFCEDAYYVATSGALGVNWIKPDLPILETGVFVHTPDLDRVLLMRTYKKRFMSGKVSDGFRVDSPICAGIWLPR